MHMCIYACVHVCVCACMCVCVHEGIGLMTDKEYTCSVIHTNSGVVAFGKTEMEKSPEACVVLTSVHALEVGSLFSF